jgi:hypothetical protein
VIDGYQGATVQIAWRSLKWEGIEHLWLRGGADGAREADGVVVAHLHGAPLRLHYRVRCDGGYRVREVVVELPAEAKRIELRSDGEGRWTNPAGHALPALDGCIDVDIAMTPFTNTLPIERLRLSPGESSDLSVAWIDAPSLEVKAVRQRYTLLQRDGDSAKWRYQSGDFSADLDVDARGLVLSYAGFWQRVGP